MIRKELHALRDMIRQTSSVEFMAYISLLVITLVVFGGSIYMFAPIDLGLRHLFFGLVVLITFAVALVAYTHSKSTKPQLPPKPKSPPTITATAQSEPAEAGAEVQRVQEITPSSPPPKRRGRRRESYSELVTENGIDWLVIHRYTPVPQGRFKRKLWRHKIQRLELDNSRYVNTKLATRIPLLPTNDEEKIYCLIRLHWWSHGPAQIGVTAATLFAVIVAVTAGFSNQENSVRTGALLTVLLIAVAGSIWYYLVWMQWGYRYLVFTNRKIRLLYHPPFFVPSKTPETDLVSLEGGLNPSSKSWGRIWGYGSIKTETVATVVDSWLLEKVTFVPHYREVAALLSQLREDALKRSNK